VIRVDQLLQHLLNGLLLGATYSLLGIGLTLVFGLMNVVNFAHGEFYTLGGYAVYAALAGASVNFFLAIPLAVLVGALAGAICERWLLRPLREASIDTVMLVMIGVWIAMQNAELLGWGGVAKSVPTPFSSRPFAFGPVSVAPLRVFVFALSGLLIVGAHLLLARTKLGRAMRATFQDRETAALMGVGIERVHTITFAFGAGLAAAAGALLGPVFLLYPSMGDLAALKAFSVVILGGLGNFIGAALGGIVLGVAEELGAGYVSSGYRDAVGFVIIVAVLLLRPSGLFARAERVG
jgi:branched-chain amino acid transport system permease protein